MIERAEELARGGDYRYIFQIERVLIEEGYTAAKGLNGPVRERLRAVLKAAKR
jgi:hypothetical protein